MPRADEAGKHPSDGRLHLAILNTLDGLKKGADALDAWLKRFHIGVEAENHARLIFDEIVTNIMRYGFDDKNEHKIGLQFRLTDDTIVLAFEDEGRPFDPRSVPDIVHPTSLAEASIGGRGLYLVRKASKTMDYARTEAGQNRLTVTLART